MKYKIEGRGTLGDWDEAYLSNSSEDNTFNTREQAEEMIPALAKVFECEEEEFRVVEKEETK